MKPYDWMVGGFIGASGAEELSAEAVKLATSAPALAAENVRLWLGLAVFYGVGVICDRCGAPANKPCMTPDGRTTVHESRVTKAAAVIAAEDLLTPDFGQARR